jgi:tripartite ATP-independent transporter DctP family solute receptor
MKKHLKLNYCVLIVVLSFALFSAYFFSLATESGKDAEIAVLKLAVESAVGTPGDLSGQDFKKIVEEKSGGRIKIEYYPAGQLGTGDELTEILQAGSVDMVWRVLDWYSNFENGWNILLLGFLFRNEDHFKLFLESEKHAEFKENLVRKSGLRVIADNGIGAPRVVIAKKPITSPSDMQGMNMRVPGIEMYQKTWSAVGVNIVEVPWGEAYMALMQGVVDALESPLGSIYGMKFHEVAKYISMTNHLYSLYIMAINETSFQRLSEDLKQILVDAAVEAGKMYVKYDQESVNKNKQEMINEGVTFIENPDIEAFQRKLEPMAQELEKQGMWPAGLYEYVQGLK